MFHRLLLAMDDSPAGQTAVSFTAGLAAGSGAAVRVLHVTQYRGGGPGLPGETGEETPGLVADAVMELLLAGVEATGLARVTTWFGVADRIAEEAHEWAADAIVVGSHRHRGARRFAGHRVREDLTRLTTLPVLIAPAPLHVGRLTRGRRSAAARPGTSAIPF